MIELLVTLIFFRGKYWCGSNTKVTFNKKVYEFKYKTCATSYPYRSYPCFERILSRGNAQVSDQQFPGFLDRGTPLVVEENRVNTIAGIFRENLLQTNRGPAVFDRLSPKVVNWIIDNSDWTSDSNCEVFTSCTCGTQGPVNRVLVPQGPVNRFIVPQCPVNRYLVPQGPVNRFIVPQGPVNRNLVPQGPVNRNLVTQGPVYRNLVPQGPVNRILGPRPGPGPGQFQKADIVPSGMYPWEAIIFNTKHKYCKITKGQNPDGVFFDICSGSLITDKHIITSASCILQNREEFEKYNPNSNKPNNPKHIPQYTKPECIYTSLGLGDWKEAVDNCNILKIEDTLVHGDALTNINHHNYNLGIYCSYGKDF